MKQESARWLTGLGAGFLFGLGLCVSGMANPEKVLAFLNVAGDWDPSLLLVMGAAVSVAFVGFRFMLKGKPLLDDVFHLPDRSDIDAQLLVGSALFGVGWGLAGYCPGPAVAALGAGTEEAVFFLAALLAGSASAGRWSNRPVTSATA